jgi:hypothetical protein
LRGGLFPESIVACRADLQVRRSTVQSSVTTCADPDRADRLTTRP